MIPKKDEAEFLEKYYLPLAKVIPVQGDDITWQEVKAEPVKRLYLSDTVSYEGRQPANTLNGISNSANPLLARGSSSTGGLQAQLRFGYGEYEARHPASHYSISRAC